MQLSVDNGIGAQDVRVDDDPSRGYFVPAGLWNDLSDFAPGTVLLAVASQPYDPADYIRDHAEFLAWVCAGA